MSKFDQIIFEGKVTRAERNLEVSLNTKKLLTLEQIASIRELLRECVEQIEAQDRTLDLIRQKILENIVFDSGI